MPKFVITEERTVTYSCTIEAERREQALELYKNDDPQFDNAWEEDDITGKEIRSIVEIDEKGEPVAEYSLENGEFQEDS